ncbi:MAG: hypothetical protein ACXAAQ_02355 [Candidatus Thorarchaeota archaeon]
MGLRDAITGYFAERPRAKKVLGIASAIAANVAMVGSGSAVLAVAAGSIVKAREDQQRVHPDQLIDFCPRRGSCCCGPSQYCIEPTWVECTRNRAVRGHNEVGLDGCDAEFGNPSRNALLL